MITSKLLLSTCFGWIAGLSLSLAEEPPVVPTPKLNIAPEDILETKTRDLGNRKIILQKVTPIELPAVVERSALVELTPEQRAARLALRQQQKPTVLLPMSVTVFRSESLPGKVRSRFRYKIPGGEEYEVFSNIDASWMSSFGRLETSAVRYDLFYLPLNQDLDNLAAAFARNGRTYQPPVIPEIPAGEPSFVITKGNPASADLAPIQALHALFKTDGEQLRIAHEARVLVQQQKLAEEKAHPPQPKDIVLRYWRVEKAASTTNGGDR